MNLDLELQALLNRFCYREGRHGETYLLEKGIQKGLVRELKSAYKKWALEMLKDQEISSEDLELVTPETTKARYEGCNSTIETIRKRIMEESK